ncbi:MAG: hypothetical protein Ct9H300mP1_09770 [Planctomycetaceae bacterium]|nr:MAG: hypothetical protein Ct9H300mP1_09770 [Planctomycetaceae bacterium]
MQSQGRQGLAVLRKQLVRSDLFVDEPGKRLVAIQRLDHPVTIPPGMRSRIVVLESVTVGVTDNIQPVLGPTVAIVRKSEQAVHQPCPRVGACVGKELVDLNSGRRKPEKVQVEPPEQRPPRSAWRERETRRLERFQDERIDGVRHPHHVARPGNRGTLNPGPKRPHPIFVLGANGNRHENRGQQGGQREIGASEILDRILHLRNPTAVVVKADGVLNAFRPTVCSGRL